MVPNFEAEDPAPEPFLPPKGLYLHGPVGCGKTLLLDMFFDGCRTERKLRVHFHAFVLQVGEYWGNIVCYNFFRFTSFYLSSDHHLFVCLGAF